MNRFIIGVLMVLSPGAFAHRCGIEGYWVTLGGNKLYAGTEPQRNQVYEWLHATGVCNDINARLGVSFPYLTIDGRAAFGDYAGRKDVMIDELVRLSQAGAGKTSTSRCTAWIRKPEPNSLFYRIERDGVLVSVLPTSEGYYQAAEAYAQYLDSGACQDD